MQAYGLCAAGTTTLGTPTLLPDGLLPADAGGAIVAIHAVESQAAQAVSFQGPGGTWTLVEEEAVKTAIVVVDMWDDHHRRSAERRVAELAPFMNRVRRRRLSPEGIPPT